MNEFQFDLCKTFLDGFKVPAKRIAKEWKIEPMIMQMVVTSPNWQQFNDLQSLNTQGGVFR